MKSYIMLENITFFAYHGVLEHEREVGNIFVLNVRMKVDLDESGKTDDLKDTVNYADVYEIVKQEMVVPSKLLEHVATRIIRRLKKEFSQIESVELKLSKKNPPVGGAVEFASVELID